MKEIPLTQGQIALVDDQDFELAKRWNWRVQKNRHTWYAIGQNWINGKTKKIFMHRIILPTPKGVDVDHIDHDGLNNQRSNLRIATRSQNNQNQRPRKTTSQFKGVSWDQYTNKWRAYIFVERKQIHLGYFKIEREAALAYDQVAKKYFGEFAQLNFEDSFFIKTFIGRDRAGGPRVLKSQDSSGGQGTEGAEAVGVE